MKEVVRFYPTARQKTNKFCKWKAHKSINLFAVGIVIVLLMVACKGKSERTTLNGQSSPTECRSVQHEMGKTQICRQPQRIVALGPSMMELLLALEKQPVGYADLLGFHRGDFDNPSQQIPLLGNRVTQSVGNVGTSSNPSLEAIARLKPDLILGTEANREQYATLSQIAPTLILPYGTGDDWQRSLQMVAQVLGHPEQAQKVLEAHNQRLATARQKFSSITAAHKRVLMLASTLLSQDLRIQLNDNSCGALVEKLGFQLVSLPNSKRISVGISQEALPKLKTDMIFILGGNRSVDQTVDASNFEEHQLKAIKRDWQKNAIAQSLPASKENRVYFISGYRCLAIPGPVGAELFLDELRRQLL